MHIAAHRNAQRYLDAFWNYKIISNRFEVVFDCVAVLVHQAAGTGTNLSLFDEFTISIMCALCGAMSHCCRLFFLRPKSWFNSQNSAQFAFVEILFFFPFSHCIFIVALACFVRLTFQVQVYYHRWCNGCVRRRQHKYVNGTDRFRSSLAKLTCYKMITLLWQNTDYESRLPSHNLFLQQPKHRS